MPLLLLYCNVLSRQVKTKVQLSAEKKLVMQLIYIFCVKLVLPSIKQSSLSDSLLYMDRLEKSPLPNNCKSLFVNFQKVNCVKFNQPDSTVIISGSYDATVRCWDCRSRSLEPIQILDDAKDSVSSLAVSQHEILSG